MTQTSTECIETLRAAMGGTVITADDPGYEQARTVWNAAIDRRPAAIAKCATALDVVAAVRFARDQDWKSRCAAVPTACPGCPSATTGW